MASGRILKTQISLSEQVNDLSLHSALLFTWMIPHSDDFGRMVGSSRKVKALVVPMRDDFTASKVEECLNEISYSKLIERYKVNGEFFLQFPGWDIHQSGLHKRTKSKIPSPNYGEFPGSSGKFSVETETETEKKRAMSFLQNDRTVVESVQTEVGSVLETKRPSSKKLEVLEIFEYWKTVMNHTAAKLDAKREKAIGDALKLGYSTEKLKAAVMGCSVTPFNCGENDRNTRFDSIGIIFKNADQIERFAGVLENPVKKLEDPGERKYKVLN